ncbi:hypothetical protein HDF14_000120 [Edaphobacter lichenicola]|uniref:Uncharacterized protein n=1 Tax=Tunturiibacter gelidiferens TaxID=3069689 RepID=A0A9X0U1I6_9BACT|nr:hypothetical protein [Edaphobacter lichenicola]
MLVATLVAVEGTSHVNFPAIYFSSYLTPEQTYAELLPVFLATSEPFRRRHSYTLRKDSR